MTKEEFNKKLSIIDEEIAYHTAMEKHHKKEKETYEKARIQLVNEYLNQKR